jgi:hypothetical protein
MKTVLAIVLLLSAGAAFGQRDGGDDPEEYRDNRDAREAYRRGYERGYDRGFERGLQEGQKRGGLATQNMPPPPPPAPPPPVLGPIKVTSAFYGSGKKNCDATRYVARKANGNRTHSFKVTNDMCGDPDRGQRKTLEVTYWCGQVSRTASAREHQDIYLNCH